MVAKKFNPFRPGAPVPPGIFAGRIREIEQMQKCIYQTINNRPQHLMIYGERGIGKTSIAYFTRLVAKGELETFDNDKLNLYPVALVTNKSQKLEDILSNFIALLQKRLGDGGSEILKKIWDNMDEITIGPAAFKKAVTDKKISITTDDFCYFIEAAWEKLKTECDGIIFIIDEFDRLEDYENVASFFKSLFERLEMDGYTRLMFLLSGMPSMREKLYKDHPSVLRNFEPIELKAMPKDEAREVIKKALNEVDVKIAPEAEKLIIDIAEGYPHFLQEAGYSAYEVDNDGIITPEDVKRGVLGTELYPGSISRLGGQYFDKMYHMDIQSDVYREILNIIAWEKDLWVSRKNILAKFSKGKTVLGTYLNNLTKRDILVKDKSRLGYYTLPNQMFRIYIRMKRKLQ